MRKLLAANWKMHLYADTAQALAQQLRHHWQEKGWQNLPTVIFPPLLYLREIANILKHSSIQVGAQNAYPGEFGAFTGEVSVAQVSASGGAWLIVGHSERRQYFAEKAPLLQRKLLDAQHRGLKVIYCIGETLEERRCGETLNVLRQQILEVLQGVSVAWNQLAIAYEPVWAIGTGINATPDQAQEAHAFIRQLLTELGAPASHIPILYGGSLKPENAHELFRQPDIDGGLVGGASLQANSFAAIAAALWDK
ncbi:MAG: triose-phosphate isomerase [Bacteroidia bacterium]|nr:triose-phosphate isomerase [Bacteroidia bacterium]MDW8235140.1 triose-phosphate isomerase [Bacteroidia bacterium]